MVTIWLAQNETVLAEAGSMVNMSGTMTITAQATGGIFKGLKRMVSGESFFLTLFRPESGDGYVSFAGNVPGKVFAREFTGPGEFIAQKDSYLCATSGVDLDIAFTKKIRAGLFGGEGFVLQKISGNGTAFFHCCGDIMEIDLKPGEVIKVQTGLVVGFDSTVQYSIALAGGITTVFFGGQGLFLTTLTGPGKVIVQSMDVAKLAEAIIPFLPKPSPQSSGR